MALVGRLVWLFIFAVTIGAVILVCLASAVTQLLSGISLGTTSPGHDASELLVTQRLSSLLSSYASELATPCDYDAARERTALLDVLQHAKTQSLDAASTATFVELLVTCTRRASCEHRGDGEPLRSRSAESAAPLEALLRSWQDAIAEWRSFGCVTAGPFVEAAVVQSAVCHAESPWPRMLATALLSAVPCTLPASHSDRPRLSGGTAESVT